jgi:hypothetical protein
VIKLSSISSTCNKSSTNTPFICVYLSLLIIVLISFKSNAIDAISTGAHTISPIKTNLRAKFYQRALYYYFQRDYVGALNIISQSKLRLGSLDQTSRLFEAGLQIKIGLQEEAKKNLLSLINTRNEANTKNKNSKNSVENQLSSSKYTIDTEQLLVLALLSLAEQFINQGQFIQAQQSLANITQIMPRYYQQYYVLSQLAYWPEKPTLLLPSITINSENNKGTNANSLVEYSPYIQLNEALRFIENNDFEQAITLLEIIKNKQWQAPDNSFFQSLFSIDKQFIGEQANTKLQDQAIDDYAQLLLASVYAQQEEYKKVYYELENFPQQSPYTESALFLFAFSAQQIKQHTTALSLLTLLHEQYPYTPLGWQANLLMAKEITNQKGLVKGWEAYEAAELFYLNKIKELHHFEKKFIDSSDLLSFSTKQNVLNEKTENSLMMPVQTSLKLNVKSYSPESVLLQQAMYDVSLNTLYQHLVDVTELHQYSKTLKQKSNWIVQIINLNIKRKSRLSASQSIMAQQGAYKKLLKKRDQLSSILSVALNKQQSKGQVFANEKEQIWLKRLNKSKESLNYIIKHSDKNELIRSDYQKRLNRIQRVISWQLTKELPQRAWQHKQEISSLNQSLKQTESLQTSVILLLNESLETIDSSKEQNNTYLTQFIERQITEDEKINPLINKLTKVKVTLSSHIRKKVTRYIKEQEILLAQHLLTTRKAMAAVLERMSANDEKIEKQLNLDENENLKLDADEIIVIDKAQLNTEQSVKEQVL